MRRTRWLNCGIAFLCSAILLSHPVFGEANEDLSNNPQWLALLHIRPSNLGHLSSDIESQEFYLSPRGREDPGAELDATILALKDPETSKANCRFPARNKWLREIIPELGKIPQPDCPELNTWISEINAAKATLIFPSSFLNNPASAFGHTFLRLDPAQESPSLLSYAVNYSAQTGPDNAIIYAIKGVFGGYAGSFAVGPYYQQVTQYSDLENRDIWEIPLDLTPKEVELLTLHLWELKNQRLSYYYFDENCAFQILSLLDVARPSLSLSTKFKTWVIPTDTIRALEKRMQLSTAQFRASAASTLKQRLRITPKNVQKLALSMAEGRNTENIKYSDEESATALELAHDKLLYDRRKGLVDEHIADQRLWEMIQERSKLPILPAFSIPAPDVRPYEGHNSTRATIGFGRISDRSFALIGTRFALHDLLDPSPGYVSGSQIEFADFALRAEEKKALRIDHFWIVDAASLSPRNDFLQPNSWQLYFGFDRGIYKKNIDSMRFTFHGGLGDAWQPFQGLVTYILLSPDIRAEDDATPYFGLGLGPVAGVDASLSEDLHFTLESSLHRFWLGDFSTELRTKAGFSVTTSTQTSLRVSYQVDHGYGETAQKWLTSFQVYFAPP